MVKDYALDLKKAMAEGKEQQNLIPAVQLIEPIEGEAAATLAAAKVNSDLMKTWKLYLCWLVLVASAMVLTNHFIAHGGNNYAVLDSKMIIPALVKFVVFLCAICLMFRTMKQ